MPPSANRHFDWFTRNGFTYIPSEANCFMVDTKRPGQQLRDAMAKENVFVGRIWPIMPTWVRITVGTQPEMERFQSSFAKAMKAECGPEVWRARPRARPSMHHGANPQTESFHEVQTPL